MKTYIEIIKEKIDYCSGVPDFPSIASCCEQHDKDYTNIGKFRADWRFFACMNSKASDYDKVSKKAFIHTVAGIYYLGVSIFGWLPYFRAQKK